MMHNCLMPPRVNGCACPRVNEYSPFLLPAATELSLDFLPHFSYIA